MAIEYFCAYHSFLEIIEPLSDSEIGRLFKASLVYSKTGETIELLGNERFLFPVIKTQIDRDKASYEKKVDRQRANGLKGGRPKKEKPNGFSENPKNPRVFSETQKSQDKDEYKDKDKDKERKKKKETDFLSFWTAYPKKVGKATAQKAFAKVDVDVSVLIQAVEQQKSSKQWSDPQYIPHPTTWLNQKRWEDETEQQPVELKQDGYVEDFLWAKKQMERMRKNG